MNRRAGGWDQDRWGGDGSDPAASTAAWDRLPPVLKGALVWVFLRGGPSTPEDLVRLHDGLAYGERGPIALAVREEPRWMAEQLKRLMPTLSWVQVETAVSIFMAPMTARSVKNRRLRMNETGNDPDTWQAARKGESRLRQAEALDYLQWIPSPLPDRRDFLLWLHAAKDGRARWLVQQARDSGFPTLPSPNGTDMTGRIFPVDLGIWMLQKQLFDDQGGLQWGYGLWRTAGAAPDTSGAIQMSNLRVARHPRCGLVVARPGGQDAFIGGRKKGLKDFDLMISQALMSLDDFDSDMHIAALIHGREREAFAGVSHTARVRRPRGIMRRVPRPSRT